MWRLCFCFLLLGALVGYVVSRWEQEQLWYTRIFRLVQAGLQIQNGNLSWQSFGSNFAAWQQFGNIAEHAQYSVPIVGLWLYRSGALTSLLSGALVGQRNSSDFQAMLPHPPAPVVQPCLGQCYYCARGEPAEGGTGGCYLHAGHRERYPGGHICRPCLLDEANRFRALGQ